VVGCHKTQRNNLDKLSDIISSYLEDIAETWVNHRPGRGGRGAKSEREQKEIDKLVHEISNPLSVIGNYIDIVNARSGGTGSDKEIGVLKEELQRVRNIVLNFKQGSEPEPEPEAVMLNAELESSIPLYVKSVSPGLEIQIMWDLDRNDAEIDITRDAFRQIVLNLVKTRSKLRPTMPRLWYRATISLISAVRYMRSFLFRTAVGVSTRRLAACFFHPW